MLYLSKPTWSSVEHLLSTFDGAASELFVIDLPAARLSHVLGVIAALPDLAVDAGTVVDSGVMPESLPDLERILSERPTHDVPAFIAANGTKNHLQIYVWMSEAEHSFDLEFVFWNDLTFPEGLDVVESELRFNRLRDLAESCRAEAPGARCILSPEHNGDPRELLTEPSVVVW